METHADGFGSFMFDSVVDEANCSGVFDLYWCGRLIVSHFFKGNTHGHSVFGSKEGGSDLGFYGRTHIVLICFARTWTVPLGCGVLVDFQVELSGI